MKYGEGQADGPGVGVSGSLTPTPDIKTFSYYLYFGGEPP